VDDVACIVLVDYIGASTPLGAVSMYVEYALKLHSSQIDIRPIHWRCSSRLRGAVIILPDNLAARALVQYCSAQWAATSAMSDRRVLIEYMDATKHIQDKPIEIHKSNT